MNYKDSVSRINLYQDIFSLFEYGIATHFTKIRLESPRNLEEGALFH